MKIGRREFVAATVAAVGAVSVAAQEGKPAGPREMYGLIGKMKVAEGQRDALIAILLEGTGTMPGCLSYVVARDPADANGIWITEVWDSKESHVASLALPDVKAAIAKGRPLITGFENAVTTTPVGGVGLPGRA
jgi:quinol monooxygenase YgiN